MVLNFFTRDELKGLGVIFLILIAISIPNFTISIKRARDVTRKDDIRDLAQAARDYQGKYFFFPESIEPLAEFLPAIPKDPQNSKGVEYVYISNGRRFQTFASLEDKNQDEYDETVEKRNIKCGVQVCNFGRSSGKTPLDKSLEEYENEIYAK